MTTVVSNTYRIGVDANNIRNSRPLDPGYDRVDEYAVSAGAEVTGQGLWEENTRPTFRTQG